MFKRLLVPLDGSSLAESVLPIALFFAEKFGAAIMLFHAIEQDAPTTIHGERHLADPREAEVYLNEIAARLTRPTSEAIRLAASYGDPATYPDMAWHFARLTWGQEAAWQALRSCSGYDWTQPLRQAWQMAQSEPWRRAGWAGLAAAQGWADALVLLVNQAEGAGSAGERQSALKQLAGLVAFTGTPEELAAWLDQHFHQLRFNPSRGRYE